MGNNAEAFRGDMSGLLSNRIEEKNKTGNSVSRNCAEMELDETLEK
jgi:hypothetical protein